ncbi:uncharacterized protein LOC114356674 [Ostrinia furnacalis]|uniref:uncharacterized protein LOC114356674 n=1 Tax=Ostrinia furnacalis TaxID=93504 RepID=UPI001040B668|nr:uncharacterized protein LOC114356674 [Ostrinia furnacalis]
MWILSDHQPCEIDIPGVLPSAEKMEEWNQLSANNLITDTEMVYEYQHDSGVDSPLENLLDLLPVYPEEDALLETIAAMDIPDPLDIDLNPSDFLLLTYQRPTSFPSKLEYLLGLPLFEDLEEGAFFENLAAMEILDPLDIVTHMTAVSRNR